MSDAPKLPHGIEPVVRGRQARTVVPAPPANRQPIALRVGAGCLAAFVLAMLLGLGGIVAYDHWPVHVDPPAPTPIPVPVGELRVIIIRESSSNETRQQLNTIYSTKVDQYLNDHCGKDKDGRPAWRRWDKDTDAKGESDTWQAAWKAVKEKLNTLPAVAVFRGEKATLYPLPDTADDLIKLIDGGKPRG